MGGKRRLIGWVLAIALAAAASAVPAQAAGRQGDGGGPVVLDSSCDERPAPGWLRIAWSWWTALFSADNGQIVP